MSFQSRLAPNPYAKVGIFPNRQTPNRIVVCAPSRRRGLVKNVVDEVANPEAWSALRAYIADDDRVPLELLHELGVWLTDDEVPNERPAFSCWFDELSPWLPSSRQRLQLTRREDIVFERTVSTDDPELWLESTFEWGAPDEWLVPPPRAWVPDLRTGVKWCYGFRGADVELFENLERGIDVSALDDVVRGKLHTAGILVDHASARDEMALWVREVRTARHDVAERAYATLSRVIADAQCRALGRYVRDLVAQGFVKLGDGQVELRYAAHNEGVSRYLHKELTSVVADVFGVAVKPSYCYLTMYLPGAVLRRHIDRPQSEYSLNVLLDCEPTCDGRSQWPLDLEPRNDRNAISVYQTLGEGVLYHGTKVSHSRPALPAGGRSTSLFLQYVPIDFDGSLL